MENIGIVITARADSKRLKQKVYQRIKNKTTFEILCDHVINDKYPTILATTTQQEDDELCRIAEEKGIEIYRGQDSSPLHRLSEVAKKYSFSDIVRITSDDILIDQFLLRKQIDWHVKGGQDYTYMGRCPEGVAGEVIKTHVLNKIAEREKKDIEFVSYYFKKDHRFKEFYPPMEYQYPFRLTLDYEEDLMMLRVLFASLQEPFGTLDIINFIKKHRELKKINKLPDVSIYTCVYNAEKYISRTMQSIIDQELADDCMFEYIIIDDCSTDNTLNQIIKLYSTLFYNDQRKIRIIKNQQNINLASSSNKALEMAKGKYIMRVDADDTLNANAVSTMINFLEANNLDCVYSMHNKIDESDNIITQKEKYIHPACCLMTRKSVNEVKFRDGLKYMDGEEFFKRYKALYNVGMINEVLWNYRQHNDQKIKQDDYPTIDAKYN